MGNLECSPLSAKEKAKRKHKEAVKICSDKVGAISQRRMKIILFWNGEKLIHFVLAPDDLVYETLTPDVKIIFLIGVLCNGMESEIVEEEEQPPIRSGSLFDTAILSSLKEKCDIDIAKIRKENQKVFEIPFNSKNKYQLTIHEQKDDPEHLLVMKGAPEVIIDRCSHILVNGTEQPLDEKMKEKFEDECKRHAGNSYRLLGFCRYFLPTDSFPQGFPFQDEPSNFPVSGFCFVGLVALADPLPVRTPSMVESVKTSGIKVVLITSEHPITSKQIALSTGIIAPSSQIKEDVKLLQEETSAEACIVNGLELSDLNSSQLDAILKCHKEFVFARTSPEQKLMIVEACQRQGVAVSLKLGPPPNDKALKRADICIVMD